MLRCSLFVVADLVRFQTKENASAFRLYSSASLHKVIVLFPSAKENKAFLSPFKIFFCGDA